MNQYIEIGKINQNKIAKYSEKIITNIVILTYERLNNHILKYHKKEYYQIEKYIREIIEEPDFIIEDNSHKDTLIFLKHIVEIDKKARVVVKLATNTEDKTYTKNSIITIMRQRDKSWEQTLKNRGKIFFKRLDKDG